MSIFISHVEENQATSEAIVRGLQSAGYEAWSYELSSVPGPTYLLQVMNAIEQASAVILVISPQALGSHQVAREIEAAHELDRPIIPVLQDITHEKYLQRRPEWRLALGGYTSIEVPRDGVDAIMHKIVGGLQAFGVQPGEPTALPKPPPRPHPRRADALRRPWSLATAAVLVVAVVAGAVVWVLSSRHDQSGKPATATSATTGTPSTFPTAGSADVTQPLSKLKATLAVDPGQAFDTDTITISYSITNTSDYNFKRSTTAILVLVGTQPGGDAVILTDISQDIAAGATVKGTVLGNLTGTRPGLQQVYISVGQRITSGTTGDVYSAEVPITVKG
ncbi:MAG: toll/interleukin-1 receptor domain-containing protein [Candidatus Nanopelagicales bacterium]